MYKLPLTIKIFDYDADYPTTTSYAFYCVEIVIWHIKMHPHILK